MNILVADDDPIMQRLVATLFEPHHVPMMTCCDGEAAWEVLCHLETPLVALIASNLPGMDGLTICRQLHATPAAHPRHTILLMPAPCGADLTSALRGGADDYLTKPCDRDTLSLRVTLGLRLITLQQRLSDQVQQLEASLAHVHQLQSFLPICAYCKKIRHDRDYWEQVEDYVVKYAGIPRCQNICPDCAEHVEHRDVECLRRP